MPIFMQDDTKYTSFCGISGPSIKKPENLPNGSGQTTEHFEEVREGLLHASFVVYDNRAVGSKGCHLQGHHHTVIMMRGVLATLEETWLRGRRAGYSSCGCRIARSG